MVCSPFSSSILMSLHMQFTLHVSCDFLRISFAHTLCLFRFLFQYNVFPQSNIAVRFLFFLAFTNLGVCKTASSLI
jgi:hypothetical protein